MNPPPIILHHHEPTAASARLRKILALKDIAWRSCPLGSPNSGDGPLDMILAGKMGHPVLQKGATFWVSSLAVIDALEELYPEPTLFPNGNRGMPLALTWWSDAFSDLIDFQQIAAYAELIRRQLVDGRDFLQGPAPGLADVQAYAALSEAEASHAGIPGAMYERETALMELERVDFRSPRTDQLLAAWRARVEALGEGRRQDISIEEAMRDAKNAEQPDTDGHIVVVSSCSSDDQGSIKGRLLAADQNRMLIEITHPGVGAVTVHFPAIGYRATPV